jgi:3-methylcrotonyl-CoA carboxylase alpha subunit
VIVTPLGGGRFEVTDGDTTTLAYGVRRGTHTWVFINGNTWIINTAEPSRRARHHDEAALAAPMPATVVAINVAPGQAVAAGDVLVVLEAMKMELAVTAPHDGRITAISCRVGELVQPGLALLALEP